MFAADEERWGRRGKIIAGGRRNLHYPISGLASYILASTAWQTCFVFTLNSSWSGTCKPLQDQSAISIKRKATISCTFVVLRTMAKSKAGKGGDSIPHRHLHARISYLYQASHYLSTSARTNHNAVRNIITDQVPNGQSSYRSASCQSKSHHLLNQLRGVAKKSQIRLGKDVKHSICKRCDALLLSGHSSSLVLVNDSKGGKKPWADVYEVKCLTCQSVKRFPAGGKAFRASGKLHA